MRLVGRNGDTIELVIAGYQFPNAKDPQERYSWHKIVGRATCRAGTWRFRYPALTCDESTRLAPWFRHAATTGEVPDLTFVEPNLKFALRERDTAGVPTIELGLDLEFRPPWQPSDVAGDPFILLLQVSSDQLLEAAASWDAQVAIYPTG